MDMNSRRNFIKNTGLAVGSLAVLGTIGCKKQNRTMAELIKACRGVHNFLTTPFKSNGNLDSEGFYKNVNFHADRHSKNMSIVVSCNLGELFSLDLEEHQALAQAAVSGAQGKMPVIQGIAGGYKLSLQMARNAEAAGVDALMLFAPPHGSSTAKGILEYMYQVTTSVRMGVFVNMVHGHQSQPVAEYWAKVIEELSELPNVIGFQDSSGGTQVGHSLGSLIPDDFLWIARGEKHATQALPMGARAYTAAVACLVPKACYDFWEYGISGKIDKMQKVLQTQIDPMSTVRSLRPGYSAAGIKVALETMGRAGGPTRPPMGQVLAEDRPRISEIARQYAEI